MARKSLAIKATADSSPRRDVKKEHAKAVRQTVDVGGERVNAPTDDNIVDYFKLQLDDASSEIEYLTQEIERYRQSNETLRRAYEKLNIELNQSQYEVLRPLYRKLFRMAGTAARRVVGNNIAERIRARIPHPDRPRLTPMQITSEATSEVFEGDVVDPIADHPDVFIFAIIDWDFRVQRPQHIARELSTGRRVFYVEMTQSEHSVSIRRVQKNLYVVRLPSRRTGFIRPYVGRPSSSTVRRWLTQFYGLCNKITSSSMKHIVIQHPFWWQIVRHMPPEFEVVFDCMDDIGGFSNTESFLLALEHDLVQNCDKLIVSSDFLYKKHRAEHATNLVRNAGQIDHFVRNDEMPLPSYLRDTGFSKSDEKIRLGYVGAIAEWFDWEMVARVAEEHPSFEFHLCGSVTAAGPRNLERFSNVKFYGEVPYESVPAFIAQMDVMIIPFQIIPLIEACDPVKFYEYSAMGKPTIATRMPELNRARELVFFASNPEEFATRTFEAVSKVDEPFRDLLVEYARKNSWEDRGRQFASKLDEHPKVSVVILSYGAPAWTLATLYSLIQDGGNYPNLEIIIVDNGSSEKSLNEIKSFIHGLSSDVKLIENGENLGFAAGNNVGIRAAKGEYILLLNNDTFVAPGSIASMVRHLRNNSHVGVVGPLTNNIGNEARIEVAYSDMVEMKSVARAVTTGYRGVATEIPVVAYFAAMFRTSDLNEFGLLSENYGRGMFEDDDHCMVIRSKGYVCALAEDAFIHHHLSATFSTMDSTDKKSLFDANRAIFERKWGKWAPHKYRTDRPPQSFDKVIL